MPSYKRRAKRQYARKRKATTRKTARKTTRRKKILIYNPTYGSLQTKNLNKTLPEEERWQPSYASPKRPLKKSEIQQLLKKGKTGSYPHEFYLVKKRGRWNEKRVKKHLKQIEAFRKVNESGEPFRWRDIQGNDEEKIRLNFVPGPIVDFVNSTSKTKAVEGLTKFMLNQASASDKKKKSFQAAVRRHAEKLVDAVREGKVVLTKVREPLVPSLW
jgi:hypothetical protein